MVRASATRRAGASGSDALSAGAAPVAQLSPMSFLAWSSAEAAVQAGARIMAQVRGSAAGP